MKTKTQVKGSTVPTAPKASTKVKMGTKAKTSTKAAATRKPTKAMQEAREYVARQELGKANRAAREADIAKAREAAAGRTLPPKQVSIGGAFVWASALVDAINGHYGAAVSQYYISANRNHKKDNFARVLKRSASAPDFTAWEGDFLPRLKALGGQKVAGDGIGQAAYAAMVRETMERNKANGSAQS